MINKTETQHSEFHKGINLSHLPQPLVMAQKETRGSIASFLDAVGDKAMTVAATAFLLGMLVLCLPNAGLEWWEQWNSKK